MVLRMMRLGEEAKSIPPDVRQKYPYVDWRGMAGARDKIVHSRHIDYHKVWEMISVDVPALVPRLRKVVADMNKNSLV